MSASPESRVVRVLSELIRLKSPTPPGDVEPVASWLEEWATGLSLDVERQTVEAGPPRKDNLLIRADFGEGPTLIWNTHMDVNSPAGQVWSFDPFEPFVRGGRLYGLGACDAKGSLAGMCCALEELMREHDAGRKLSGTLVLTAVMGEEAGGLGSLHLVKRGIRADGAIVGEATGLAIAAAHKGTYMRRLRFRGKAAHSGSAHLGVNAVAHAAHFCLAVEALDERLREHPHPLLGPASAVVTIFNGGTRQNTVPESAELILDRRLLPGETHAKADRELEVLLAGLKGQIPSLDVESIEPVVATVPSETREDKAIVRAALSAVEGLDGRKHELRGFPAGCDMSKLVTMAGIPTVICGPGSLAQAHSPDEFVDLEQLERAPAVYKEIARRFLY